MKLLVVAPSAMPLGLNRYGGVELLCTTLAEAMTKAGRSVTVAAPRGSKVPAGVKLIETVTLPAYQDRDDVTENVVRLSPLDYDVIHDFSHRNAFKSEAIHMVWDPVSIRYPKADNRQVTLSEWQKARFDKTYGQDSRVMPMWIDTDKMKPLEDPAKERLLYFGAIVPAKGAMLAIDYAKRLGIDLDVAGGLMPSEQGSPYLKEVEAACDGEHIRLHFNVIEEEKRVLIQNAKAVVYPVQQAEAHWVTGMECWCAGTPTLSINRGAMAEITNPFWGVVADDEGHFRDWMRLFSRPDFEWDRLSGVGLAHEAFSIKTVLPKWLRLYEQVKEGLTW